MRWRRVASLGLALTLACSDSPVEPTFEALSGTYDGSFTSTEAGGDTWVADFSLQLTQSGATLSGTWSVDGLINGGTTSTGTGPFTATVPIGNDPSFTAQLAYDLCPTGLMTFTGSYDSSTGTLDLAGDLDIPASNCVVQTTYPVDLNLTR